jgi:hypothetical protein
MEDNEQRVRDYNWAVAQAFRHAMTFGGDIPELIISYIQMTRDIKRVEEKQNDNSF